MSAGRDPAAAAAHVRFAPKATVEPSHCSPPLRANRVPMHRNKGHLKEAALDHLALPAGLPPQHARPIRSESRALVVASIARGRRWLDELLADANANAESIAKPPYLACLFEVPAPKHPNGPPGTDFLGGGDKRAENPHRLSMYHLRDRPLPHNPANSADFARSQELPGSTSLLYIANGAASNSESDSRL
jgi:hypothetical protein